MTIAMQGHREAGSRARSTPDATFHGSTGTQFHKALYNITRTSLVLGMKQAMGDAWGSAG
ncbi:hypothetical protein [Rhodanobacter koreensis]